MACAIFSAIVLVATDAVVCFALEGDQTIKQTDGTTAKERIAKLLIRMPWITDLPRTVYRWTQAHFTAGVVGVVLNGTGQILLVEHVYHPRVPWGLPGGWLGRGENPGRGLKRELKEETGVEIKIRHPLIISNGYIRQHLDVAFLCDAQNDVQHLSDELLDYRWLDPTDIPELLPFHDAAIQQYLSIGQDYARSEPAIS